MAAWPTGWRCCPPPSSPIGAGPSVPGRRELALVRVRDWNALADPGIRAVVTELLDIDSQVKVEQLGVASSRAHERLVQVLDDVDDMVLIGHPTAGLVYWNHAAEARLTDLRTGVPIGDLMAPTVAHLVDSTIRPLFDRMERWSGDLDLEFRDGQVHTLAATVTPVLDGAEARYFGVILRDVTAERHHTRQLDELAHVDPLTSLPNRLSLDEMLSAISANDVALCFIDLDHLKVVNDGLGHGAGDKLLVAVADTLVELPGVRTVTRFGGDEFVVVHSDIGSIDHATDLATKLLHAIEDVRVPDVPTRLSASVGVAWTPIDDLDPEELIKNADTAMYAAKRRGRGRIARLTTTSEKRSPAASYSRLPSNRPSPTTRSRPTSNRWFPSRTATSVGSRRWPAGTWSRPQSSCPPPKSRD